MIPGPLRRFLGAALLLAFLLSACSPPEHAPVPTPAPTPVPSPTPLYIPYKRLDTGKLFSGVQLQTTFSTEPGGAATTELAIPSSYSLHLDLHVRIPRAVTTRDGLLALNPALPTVLSSLNPWLASAHISPLYERLYRHKVQSIEQNFLRLDQLLSRHDFFDCETILEFQAPATPRKVLWIQSDMDVDSDGSDADRVPVVDAASQTFQPLTSYKWPKRGDHPNSFIAARQARLLALQASLPRATTPAQQKQIQDALDDTKQDIKDLKKYSFLVAATDPYIVIPGSVTNQHDDPFSPSTGDYCAVIYKNVIYPAVVGDVGPPNKVGEASLRIAQQLNPLANSENRPVSSLKITYLVFPGTADHPFGPPNLNHWHDRVDALLKEAGGYTGQLFVWNDLTLPPPTPTPSPTPAATPSVTPSPSPSASASPSASPSP